MLYIKGCPNFSLGNEDGIITPLSVEIVQRSTVPVHVNGTLQRTEPNPAMLRSLPIETQRLSPHGSFQCHEPRGSSVMQAFAVCRATGNIGPAYVTGREEMIGCVENNSGCRPDPSARRRCRYISTAKALTNQIRARGRTSQGMVSQRITAL